MRGESEGLEFGEPGNVVDRKKGTKKNELGGFFLLTGDEEVSKLIYS
jgi:hypothetical protein